MHEVVFSESAVDDIKKIVSYISHYLGAQASEKLKTEIISAPDSIREFPYSHPVYILIRPLEHEYRRIYVDNYVMYYTINEQNQTISIERVIYAKRQLADEL